LYYILFFSVSKNFYQVLPFHKKILLHFSICDLNVYSNIFEAVQSIDITKKNTTFIQIFFHSGEKLSHIIKYYILIKHILQKNHYNLSE